AVKNPMLAELPDGSRVDDAIQAAGGLKQEADMSNINRAEVLIDGQKIFIPSLALDEDGNVISDAQAGTAGSSGTDSTGKVNINTADSSQLQTLNGVGPATAQKIIDYRQSNGTFSNIEDIRNVSGIGDKTFEKLKDHITI
ncbi:MAG: helix-hairpin-helix domain-containing protein, partial [Firmicutes bacterium]|nr:helix-hairpin-helix domain-containing protein [Bacillota bacterium]